MAWTIRTSRAAIATAAFCLLLEMATGATLPRPGVDWPQFRGIRGLGVDDSRPAPVSWHVGRKEGVRWRTPIPGLGHASPIVWGDSLYVATSIGGRPDASLRVGYYGDIEPVNDDTPHEWRVYALDKRTGSVKWNRTAASGKPKIKRHPKATHANSTMATDGERLIAFFGSEGLYAFDMNGNRLWSRDLGVLDAGFYQVPEAQWSTASSPILHDDVVIVQADVQKNSFLAAFDAKTGRDLWRVQRADVPTWSTPAIHHAGERTQVIVNGMRHAGAYDFKTGAVIWKLSGGGDIPVPTPVVSDGVVFITSAHGTMAPVYAIRDTAQGDISLKGDAATSGGVVWSYLRGGAYMSTPLAYRGLLYVVTYNGILTAYDARSGEKKYTQRLAEGAVTASPVGADGKVYFANEDGHIYVVGAGPSFRLLATNDMEEPTLASPAMSEGMMFWRTQRHVVALGGR
jgi:outer membrane protein assembly factor BamB